MHDLLPAALNEHSMHVASQTSQYVVSVEPVGIVATTYPVPQAVHVTASLASIVQVVQFSGHATQVLSEVFLTKPVAHVVQVVASAHAPHPAIQEVQPLSAFLKYPIPAAVTTPHVVHVDASVQALHPALQATHKLLASLKKLLAHVVHLSASLAT